MPLPGAANHAASANNGGSAHNRRFSGLYRAVPPTPANGGPGPIELRVDVDGVYTQMAASGTFAKSNGTTVSWMARVKRRARGKWSGKVAFRKGPTRLLPATHVSLVALPAEASQKPGMQVTFRRARSVPKRYVFRFESHSFHAVDFEFDHTSSAEPALSYKTGGHSNRPRRLRAEDLTIGEVFNRAGFDVTSSPGNVVSLPDDGEDLWDDDELNDAMETSRTHGGQRPQWSLWVFTAGQHVAVPDTEDKMITPRRIGGVMFDSTDGAQRQGAAIFNESFISDPPVGEAEPDAWVQRQRFWCTCHEMAHAFNLAHSFEKTSKSPWLPQRNSLEARSFTNYPHLVRGGQSAFFRSFGFRFTNHEMLFLRHAPSEFVQMGNADFLHGHAAIGPKSPSRASGLTLQVRVNRNLPRFSFLEPVALELKLANTSNRVVRFDRSILQSMESLSVFVRKRGGAVRRLRPFFRHRLEPEPVRLPPGKALYMSVFVSCGADGWLIAEPGDYSVRAVLRLPGEDLASNTLTLSVQDGTAAEHRLSRDYFSTDVGRVLVFDGSRVLNQANATLERVADELSGTPVAMHAKLALACGLAKKSKQLRFDYSGCKVVVEPADDRAFDRFRDVLIDHAGMAIETLGHIDYRQYVDWVAWCLEMRGEAQRARPYQEKLLETMSSRRVRERPIDPAVLDSIRQRLAGSSEERS